MTAEAIESRKLDIGRVIQETFQVLGRNIVTFSVMGLILSGLPALVIGYIQMSSMRGQLESLSEGNFNLGVGFFQGIAMSGIAGLIMTSILQGALIYATVQDLNGQKASVGESLATGLRNFVALIAVTILFVLAVALGFVFLIVPGIMIGVAWCVAVPALVADRTGIFGAFGRAAELTRGNRWRIFALFVLLWIVVIVLSNVVNAISGVGGAAALGPDAIDRLTSPLFLGLSVLQQTITSIVGATLVAVLYVELRRLREGAGPQWLAEIFS